MKKKAFLLILIFLYAIPTTAKADGQDFIATFLDSVLLIFIFFIWIAITKLLFFVITSIRKKVFTKKQKYLIWVFGFVIASFCWIMTKSDPYPYDGPIDSFLYKDKIEKSRINDSLELINGKSDSTIESVIASIDTTEIGVYIWLNHRLIFVRKLTPDIKSQREEDALTMSIVRGWTKEKVDSSKSINLPSKFKEGP